MLYIQNAIVQYSVAFILFACGPVIIYMGLHADGRTFLPVISILRMLSLYCYSEENIKRYTKLFLITFGFMWIVVFIIGSLLMLMDS